MPLDVARCPSCGAQLEVSKSSEIMTCEYCGSKVVVNESLNGIKGETKNFLDLANNEFKLGNYEKARQYFEKVLETNPKNYTALFLKGLSSGQQFNINDFKFKELLQGYSDARKYIPDEGIKDFISYASDSFYNHGLNCEKVLQENFVYGVDDKKLGYYVEKYFQIINFYDETYRINEFDLRSSKRIMGITKSLKSGVKGKGNRYDNNCELILDWKFSLSDDIIEKLNEIENLHKSNIQKYEPEIFPVERKTVFRTCRVCGNTINRGNKFCSKCLAIVKDPIL
jgi:tetratricopeptide (TPR) repeat protein